MLALGDVAALVRRLREAESHDAIPLLVVRLRGLERIAWREGRSAARAVERRSLRAFERTSARTLRASDVLAHDAESEDFIAALVSRTRDGAYVATPTDCRAALVRLASAMELDAGMRVESGWTLLRGLAEGAFPGVVEAALERGARERERYDFFSTIGHELRTPLTSIRGYLETLLDEELDAATQRRFLTIARDEALRLGRLVEGMFELSLLDLRAETGRTETASLGAALEAACNTVAPMAAAARVLLDYVPCRPRTVAIGADRLTQVVVNLLENAIKHGRTDGRVVVSIAPLDARYVEVRVADDGPGIAPGDREAIFSLARRGRDVRAPGSGIGLALVRLMVERIGGEVDVTQNPPGGALFRVRLPCLPNETPQHARAASTAREA